MIAAWFKSKESLLEAGIDRQLDRRRAMHDIRSLFAGLGDLHTELTLLGRYLLSVIDEESPLLQMAVSALMPSWVNARPEPCSTRAEQTCPTSNTSGNGRPCSAPASKNHPKLLESKRIRGH
jgi:hypothetical protein